MTLYLADTSIWSWAHGDRRPDIAQRLAERLERQQVATCHAVVIEHQHRARTGSDFDWLYDTFFEPADWLPSGDRAWGRAFGVQRSLAASGHGNHRRPALDYVIAATAELAPDVVLWAFDRDMRVICDHTGQPCELETADRDVIP